MQTPNLTALVEQKLLSVIKTQEVKSVESSEVLRAENYIKLADLYHFHKSFENERKILCRFVDSPHACQEELQDIYERIEHLAKTQYVLGESLIEKATKKESLALEAIESEPEIVELHSRAKVNLTHISPQIDTELKSIKFLTICAAYTGKKENEEVVQLSIVLTEYCADNNPAFSLHKTYTGTRATTNTTPERVFSKFNIQEDEYLKNPLNNEQVIALFDEANYIVSHNNPELERHLLVTLMPEIINSQWYSTQKDIPWRALGFESVRLSKLIAEFGRRKPRTTLERAKAISFLLQQKEPSGETIYFERIKNMKPMKSIELTSDMRAANKSMSKKRSSWKLFVGIIFLLGISAVVALKSVGFFEQQ